MTTTGRLPRNADRCTRRLPDEVCREKSGAWERIGRPPLSEAPSNLAARARSRTASGLRPSSSSARARARWALAYSGQRAEHKMPLAGAALAQNVIDQAFALGHLSAADECHT